MAAREIDDREPAMAKTDAGLDVIPAAIRSAMTLPVVHALEQRAIDFGTAARIEHSRNTAHGVVILRLLSSRVVAARPRAARGKLR